MIAAEYDRFGPAEVLVLRDRPNPRPKPGAIRIAVRAAALNPKDVLLRKGRMRWLQGTAFPKGTAHDFAGVVEGLGEGASGVQVGDQVFGMLGGMDPRAAAEMLVAGAEEWAPMPPGLDFGEAASLPLAGLTALQALRDVARLQPGQRLVVRGASGGVGTLAVQIGAAMGARVVAVCSAKNRGLVEGLGAAEVCPYDERTEPGSADVFFDAFGDLGSAKAQIAPGGTYVTTLPRFAALTDAFWAAIRGRRARLVVVRPRARDLEHLASLVAAGAVRPVLDARFPLADIRSAHRRVETRRCRGKVVIDLDPSPPPQGEPSFGGGSLRSGTGS